MAGIKHPLLNTEKLTLHFQTTKGTVRAVDGVDFDLNSNEAIVVLGESGCGKSSLAKALLRLLPRNVQTYSGAVNLEGVDVMKMSNEEYRQKVRWMKMSMVPQAAMNALNPVMRVGDQVAEPVIVHNGVSHEQALLQTRKMFQHVGVPTDFINRYAFELSGGMRQRVAIAMALVTLPRLVILDEPTSALDVLTQANIMNVLKRIKEDLDMSYVLITHDIATSSELADRVAVMYAGQIVEVSDADSFFEQPQHPYSRKLLASVPKLHGSQEPEFITGQPPSLFDLPAGCRFAPRCQACHERCTQDPPTIRVGERRVKCWLYANGQE
jgi:peptide/nickel transport system ATP-binding protein